MTALVIFGTFALFLLLQVPIGFSLGLASLCTIAFSGITQYKHLAQSMISAFDSFPLMAVPFFILAGDLMGTGGISRRLLQVASLICGSLSSGLGLVTIAACMFFAAISGSGPATVAAISGLMIPAMLKANYDKGFVSGLIATSGSIGVIIPPSIPMVIYCVSTNTSVGTLFIAGVVPGLLIGFALMGMTYFIAKKNGLKGEVTKYTTREKFAIIREAIWALTIPFIILGGIYGQVFTPTEAATVAVIYGAFVGVFIYRDLTLKDLPKILARSLRPDLGDRHGHPEDGIHLRAHPDAGKNSDPAGQRHARFLQQSGGHHLVNPVAAADCRMLYGNAGGHHYSCADSLSDHRKNQRRSDSLRFADGRQSGDWFYHAAAGSQPVRHLRHRQYIAGTYLQSHSAVGRPDAGFVTVADFRAVNYIGAARLLGMM
jgi:hypothetical protein